jgi:hypothetical protein
VKALAAGHRRRACFWSRGPSVQIGASLSHLVSNVFGRGWADCRALVAAGADARSVRLPTRLSPHDGEQLIRQPSGCAGFGEQRPLPRSKAFGKYPEVKSPTGALSFLAAFAFWNAVFSGPALAVNGKPTTIKASIDETDNRFTGGGTLAIEKLHEIKVTLSGANNVTESWTQTNVGNGHSQSTHADPGGDRTISLGKMTDERLDQSGAENEGRAEWRVLSEHKLQRIRAGRQLMERWDIDIDKRGGCRINVRYMLQSGATSYVAYIAATTQLAHFTLPKVQRAFCTIE